jgi:hypothetical protein
MDFPGFLKLLRLTASSHDGEALNAIRKANQFLAGRSLTWDNVVSVPSGETAPPSRCPVSVRGKLLTPPVITWAETALFLVRTRPANSDDATLRELIAICQRLQGGVTPDAEDAEQLVALYRLAGGVVR